jgi:hypothetical protein
LKIIHFSAHSCTPLLDPSDVADRSNVPVDTTETTNTDKGGTDGGSEKNDDFPSIPGAASDLYENIKDTWSWGRNHTPLGPLLGVAEGITASTAGLFGTDMKGIDDALKPHVVGLNGHVANILSGGKDKPAKTCKEDDNKLEQAS